MNYAVRRPGRAASLTLLDAVMTFDRIPVKTLVASVGMYAPGVPKAVRRRILSWISGGADVDDLVPEAQLISAGASDFVLHLPPPKPITDDQLCFLDVPVLALIAGRSVMLDAARAAARARNLLPRGQVDLWRDASHAINGEYPDEIASCGIVLGRSGCASLSTPKPTSRSESSSRRPCKTSAFDAYRGRTIRGVLTCLNS